MQIKVKQHQNCWAEPIPFTLNGVYYEPIEGWTVEDAEDARADYWRDYVSPGQFGYIDNFNF